MDFNVRYVNDASEIGDAMHVAVARFWKDCRPYANMATNDFFNLLKRLPYNMEDDLYQALVRPAAILNGQFPIVACANKAIAMASFLKCKNMPYRYKLVAKNPDDPLHHVYTETYIGGKWIPLDCTYPENRIGVTENWGRMEIV